MQKKGEEGEEKIDEEKLNSNSLGGIEETGKNGTRTIPGEEQRRRGR